jgi:hypothetical protein
MENLEGDLQYFREKRDDAIDHFAEKLKDGIHTGEELHKSLDVVLRLCKQVKVAEDAQIIYRVTKDKVELLQKLSEIKDDNDNPYFSVEFLKNLLK